MIKLFDSHAHYDDKWYDKDGETPYQLLDEIFADNVEYILGAATDVESAKRQIEFAQRYDGFYAAVGVHPESCGDVSQIPATIEILRDLADHKKVCAIGEIGLDYYWEENPPRETQKAWFEAQLKLAKEKNLPVIIHDREAHGDTFDMICKYPDVKGVFHCYAGSKEMAKELVKRGWYISFTGVVTFPKTDRVAEVVASIPNDRLLLETDAPYMAPVPKRGKRNNSSYAIHTAEKIAAIRGQTTEEIVKMTRDNAKKLFNIN